MASGLSQFNGRVLDQRLAFLLVPQLAAGQRQRGRDRRGERERPVGRLHEKVVDLLHGSLQQFRTGRLGQVVYEIEPDDQHVLVTLRRNRIPRGQVCLVAPTGTDTRLRAEQLEAGPLNVFETRRGGEIAAGRSGHIALGQAEGCVGDNRTPSDWR